LPEEVFFEQDADKRENETPCHEPKGVEERDSTLFRVVAEHEPIVDITVAVLEVFVLQLRLIGEIKEQDEDRQAEEEDAHDERKEVVVADRVVPVGPFHVRQTNENR